MQEEGDSLTQNLLTSMYFNIIIVAFNCICSYYNVIEEFNIDFFVLL